MKRVHIIAASDSSIVEFDGLMEKAIWQGILGTVVLVESLNW